MRGIVQATNANGVGVWGEHAGGGYGILARSHSGLPIVAYGAGDSDIEFFVSNSGEVFADGAFHPGGADFAEMLPAPPETEPADVLVIAEDGRLARSTSPYQRTVAGVHSTKPGFVGGGGEEDDLSGKVPLAVVGVAPVKASAENGAIHPGALLATSSTPGHAMTAGPNPAVGTVIGKALGSLASGTGVIRMLVTLQ